jgi:hypothetical protein
LSINFTEEFGLFPCTFGLGWVGLTKKGVKKSKPFQKMRQRYYLVVQIFDFVFELLILRTQVGHFCDVAPQLTVFLLAVSLKAM